MAKNKGTGQFFEMVQETLDAGGDSTERVINSGERLTVETIADFAKAVQTGLTETSTVVINFNPQVEVDITALQVFCSSCHTAVSLGKKIIYRGTLPDSIQRLSVAAGAERQDFCKNNNTSCFRIAGGKQ